MKEIFPCAVDDGWQAERIMAKITMKKMGERFKKTPVIQDGEQFKILSCGEVDLII